MAWSGVEGWLPGAPHWVNLVADEHNAASGKLGNVDARVTEGAIAAHAYALPPEYSQRYLPAGCARW